MSDDNERTTVDARNEIVSDLLDVARSPKYSGGTPRVSGLDDDAKSAFLEVAFENIVTRLAGNHADVRGRFDATIDDYDAVADVLDEEHIVDIDVNGGGWHSPTVRVWLSECPRWANTSWRTEFTFSAHREHYNGSPAHAVLDVRPF